MKELNLYEIYFDVYEEYGKLNQHIVILMLQKVRQYYLQRDIEHWKKQFEHNSADIKKGFDKLLELL